MPEKTYTIDEVFGVTRDVPLNYVSRPAVDEKLIDSLTRKHHIVIYGSSKQGKTCLRKNCLNEEDYIVVSCQNKWDLKELHAAILKETGYVVKQSTSKTVSGHAKITASAEGSVGVPFFKGKTNVGGEGERGTSKTETTSELELDPSDVNDIIRALMAINFSKYIVLEDFHYLPDDTQRDFSFALKAFHEKSNICFIIVGVWREQNRLITYNGDLTERMFSVDADTWDDTALEQVISAGEELLNVQFDETFKKHLLANCFQSVHIVQEACRRCCRNEQVFQTGNDQILVGKNVDAEKIIAEVVNEQSGRYQGFLMNFSDGFQQTDLEVPKWIIWALLSFKLSQLANGIRLRELSRRIKTSHPRGEDLNNGNITQALNSAGSLQAKKGVRPIVVDYDSSNRNLHIVDKGFLIWLASQDVEEILQDLGLPEFPEEIATLR